MANSMYIVHLSDLHIDPAKEGESRPVFEGLCSALLNFRRRKELEFSLLIVSGDLVNQGAGDYGLVQKRLDALLSATGLERDRVFMVPGNHDVVWRECGGISYQALIEHLTLRPETVEKMDPESVNQITAGFQAYANFAAQYPLLNQTPVALPGYGQADLLIAGIPVRLCGINTALVAGPLDARQTDHRLKNRVVATHLLSNMLEGADRLHIVVSHYPLSWVHKGQSVEVTERLQRQNAVLFHGHVHASELGTAGVQKDAQLLDVGAGSIYGLKWQGLNQCQILALDPSCEYPLLYEWVWFGKYGWRGFEPMEISWSAWKGWAHNLAPARLTVSNTAQIGEGVGLTAIASFRTIPERTAYYQNVLDDAAEGSDVVIVGRSLMDWSSLWVRIERAIITRKLHVKLALLDENSLLNKNTRPDQKSNTSWIEMPNPKDWAMGDVPASMEHFRKIKVQPNTGSLEIYGLPFYVSHSFVSFTQASSGRRYCLEEVGLALPKDKRHYVELQATSDDSHAASLEWMYRNFLTEDRLLLRDNGVREERDTSQRAKLLIGKIEQYGLVDLSVGRENLDWSSLTIDINKLIAQTPEGGEIFVVGRSLVSWAEHLRYEKLAEAIVCRRIKCTLVIADPRKPDLESLVKDDYAMDDLTKVWQTFSLKMPPFVEALCVKYSVDQEHMGYFELYGVPAYVPVTFAAYSNAEGIHYCTLEVGIGVTPNQRPILCFKKVSNEDIYSILREVHLRILKGRSPLVRIPKRDN